MRIATAKTTSMPPVHRSCLPVGGHQDCLGSSTRVSSPYRWKYAASKHLERVLPIHPAAYLSSTTTVVLGTRRAEGVRRHPRAPDDHSIQDFACGVRRTLTSTHSDE